MSEYSSMSFAVKFFLAEYCHIILMSALGVILLFSLGGWRSSQIEIIAGL